MAKPKTPNKSNLQHFVTKTNISVPDADQESGIRQVAAGTDCKKAGFSVDQTKKYFEMELVAERASLVKSDPADNEDSVQTIADLRAQLATEKQRADDAETLAEENGALAAKAGEELEAAQKELADLKAK